VLDQAVGEAWTAERVEARAEDRADRARVDLELVDRLGGLAQELVLDLGRATLQVARQEVRVEVQVAALDAAAVEDPDGEVVLGQAEPLERFELRRGTGPTDDGQAGDVGRRPRSGPVPAVIDAALDVVRGRARWGVDAVLLRRCVVLANEPSPLDYHPEPRCSACKCGYFGSSYAQIRQYGRSRN
jgi:hypothetical protein